VDRPDASRSDAATASPDEPMGPARSGRPDDRLSEIRERWSRFALLPGFAPLTPGYERTKERKRKQNAGRRGLPTSATAVAAARLSKRARLPAFHNGSRPRECFIPKAQRRARLRGPQAADKRRGSPAGVTTQFQRCTSRAGRSAGRLMPEPPGSQGDEPKARRHRTRSTSRGHRMASSCDERGGASNRRAAVVKRRL
jgi:hypothetical protein